MKQSELGMKFLAVLGTPLKMLLQKYAPSWQHILYTVLEVLEDLF